MDFEMASATAFTGSGYDLVFDALHDLGDPVVGLALGTQAGPARIREVVTAAGFTRFATVASTPFNHVFEVRK
ncbi:MAG: hypothetical protein ACR2LI_03770 [Propionibacteriaceae bacterium]